MKNSKLPCGAAGSLQGVRVLLHGTDNAGSVASGFSSDMGADVIHMESAGEPDPSRYDDGVYEQNHRNQRSIALDIDTSEGKTIFLRLLKDRDIFIASSPNNKWAVSDEEMWEQNPALVIVHITGFGRSADPVWYTRPFTEEVGLAFSAVTARNGLPDQAYGTNTGFCARTAALYAVWGGLAAFYRAMATGEGESVDVAQVEVMWKAQSGDNYRYFNKGIVSKPTGNEDSMSACFRCFKCSDGEYVFIAMAGPAVIGKALAFFGFEYGSELFPKKMPWVVQGTEGAKLVTRAVEEFCAQRSSTEVDKQLSAAGIPCSVVLSYESAARDPHYIARNVFTEWKTADDKTVKGLGFMPKAHNDPGKLWKPAPVWGENNEEVLEHLGYSPEDISALYGKNIINKKRDHI